jgi:hypothetical protein
MSRETYQTRAIKHDCLMIRTSDDIVSVPSIRCVGVHAFFCAIIIITLSVFLVLIYQPIHPYFSCQNDVWADDIVQLMFSVYGFTWIHSNYITAHYSDVQSLANEFMSPLSSNSTWILWMADQTTSRPVQCIQLGDHNFDSRQLELYGREIFPTATDSHGP